MSDTKTKKTSSKQIKKVKAKKAAAKSTKKPAKAVKMVVMKKTKPAPKKATRAKPKAKALDYGGKRAFVEKWPKLGAAALIEKAKAAGISVSANYIYVVRRGGRKTPAVKPTNNTKGSALANGLVNDSFMSALATELINGGPFIDAIADRVAKQLLGNV